MLLPLPRLPTDFQQPPTAEEITAFATRLLGPDTVITEAVELGGGAFNNTFRLTTADGHRSILRLSPPPAHPLIFHVEHHLLRREHSLTPWLSAVSEFLPRTLSTDFSHTICPRDAILSEFIEGENWDAVMSTLTPAENDALWRQLAALLLRIHATPAPHFGWTSPATPHARWSDFILDNIRGLLADCQRLGCVDERDQVGVGGKSCSAKAAEMEAGRQPVPSRTTPAQLDCPPTHRVRRPDVFDQHTRFPDTEARTWAAIAERCAPALDLISEPRVLHGDPWPKNVLIRRDSPDGAPRIVALLDHERGGFGDPQSEWVFHGCDFPPVFWEAYGPRPTDPASQIRAHLYRGTIAIQCLLESTRYPDVDTATPRNHLTTSTQDLQQLLTQL